MKTLLSLGVTALLAVGVQGSFYQELDHHQPGLGDAVVTCADIQDTCPDPTITCIDLVPPGGVDPDDSIGVDCGCDSLNTNAFGPNCQWCNLHTGGIAGVPHDYSHIKRFLIAAFTIEVVVIIFGLLGWFGEKWDANVAGGQTPFRDFLLKQNSARHADWEWVFTNIDANAENAPRFMVPSGSKWKPTPVNNWTLALIFISIAFLLFWEYIMTAVPFTHQDRTFTLNEGASHTKCYFYGGVGQFALSLVFTFVNVILNDIHSVNFAAKKMIKLHNIILATKEGPKKYVSPMEMFGLFPNAMSGGLWYWLYMLISGAVLVLGVFALIFARAQGNRSCCDLLLSTDDVSYVFNAILASAFLFQAVSIPFIAASLYSNAFTAAFSVSNRKYGKAIKQAKREAVAWLVFHTTSKNAQRGYAFILLVFFISQAYIGFVLAYDAAAYKTEGSLEHYWKATRLVVVGMVWAALFLIQTLFFVKNATSYKEGVTNEKGEFRDQTEIQQIVLKDMATLGNLPTTTPPVAPTSEETAGSSAPAAAARLQKQAQLDYATLFHYAHESGAMRTNMTPAHALNTLMIHKVMANATRDLQKRTEKIHACNKESAAAARVSSAMADMEDAEGLGPF